MKLHGQTEILRQDGDKRLRAAAADYDRIAAVYAWHRRVNPEVVLALHSGGKLAPDSCVLEVGCGTGNYAAALRALSWCRCWGIDPSSGMLAVARERSPGAAFHVARAECLGLQPGCFDLVFSVDVIHHVKDLLAYFREAHRVLKPGGRVCTATSSESIIRDHRPLAVYFPETVEADLARFPSVASLREFMGQTGFYELSEQVVEHAYELTDAAPYRSRAFSCLELIPESTWRQGLERMERDLQARAIPCVSRRLLLWGSR